jgi:hypothetical protein
MHCHPERSEGPHKKFWITQIISSDQRACVRSLACARDDSGERLKI